MKHLIIMRYRSKTRIKCICIFVCLAIIELFIFVFVTLQEEENYMAELKTNRNPFLKFKQLNVNGIHLFKSHHANQMETGNEDTRDEKDQGCSLRTVRLSESPLPMTGLVSCPGSGNTWVRHLIQQLTGIGTSSMDCDLQLKRRGFPYECERQRRAHSIAIKSHYEEDLRMFTKVILIIRNPFDTILSWLTFSKVGHTGHSSKELLKLANHNMFDNSIKWYVHLVNATINKFHGPVHVLQYERLERNLSQELHNLAGSLAVDVTQDDIECTVKMKEGNFHRKTSYESHLELLEYVFNDEQIMRMREAGETVQYLINEAFKVKLNFEDPFDVERLNVDNSR